MRFNQIFESIVGQLDEVSMRPTSLRKAAAAIDARAGMEFELIIPNLGSLEDGDMEYDYSFDRRPSNIDDIIDFFGDGDGLNGSSELRELRSKLDEDYMEWTFEQISSAWDDEGMSYFREYFEDHWFDRDEALDEARDRIADEGLEPETEAYTDRLREIMDEILDEQIDENWNNSRAYDEARDSFQEEKIDDFGQRDWLRDENWYMSDIESNYSINWPYTTSGDGSEKAEEIADNFKTIIGRKVNFSTSYHGGLREPNAYVIEPDGSLEGDSYDDGGLEFVSPPLPLDEMFDDLRKIKAWCEDQGIYTNQSTGLHMNISIPNFSMDKLDYIKLALFMGDEYVLKQFGRINNTYTASALGKIKKNLQSKNQVDIAALFNKIKEGLVLAASKIVHNGITNKYTSINTKGNYVEFRSPGGDWLSEDLEKVENTLLRFVVALDIACDETKYKQEYEKKLYKLISSVSSPENNDILQHFVQFSAGKMDKGQLKSVVRNAQQQRSSQADKAQQSAGTGALRWVLLLGGERVFEINADTQGEANILATRWLRGRSPEFMQAHQGQEAEVLPKDVWLKSQPDSGANNDLTPHGPGPWEIYSRASGDRVRVLDHTNRQAAQAEAQTWADMFGVSTSNIGVRTRAA